MLRSAAPFVILVVGLVATAALDASLLTPPASAAFGSPVLEQGSILIGIASRHFERDVFDVRRDQVSNPNDTFSYTALETRFGIYRGRLDLGIEVGRSHSSQDRFPDRDYLNWDLGIGVRGLIYVSDDERVDITGGAQFRESIGFDRSSSLTHKLQRNYVAYLLFGRRTQVANRPLRIYAGPLYSAHEFDEYGESYNELRGAAEGETRNDVLLLGGVTTRIYPQIETSFEIEYRESLSFGFAAGYLF
jgi:hypothetical protein